MRKRESKVKARCTVNLGSRILGREPEKLLQNDPKGGILPALGQRDSHTCHVPELRWRPDADGGTGDEHRQQDMAQGQTNRGRIRAENKGLGLWVRLKRRRLLRKGKE